VSEQLEVCSDLEALPKLNKLLATYTQEEIGEAVGLKQSTMADDVPVLAETEDLPKPLKLLATYTDAEWKPPFMFRKSDCVTSLCART